MTRGQSLHGLKVEFDIHTERESISKDKDVEEGKINQTTAGEPRNNIRISRLSTRIYGFGKAQNIF